MTIPPITDSLVITGLNFPPFSARAAKQTLVPIDAATQQARTVNGVLVDLSDAAFRKFSSTITSEDQQVPEFAWPGTSVTVDCIAELGFKTEGGTQIRNEVPGSLREDGEYTFYRPRLTMLIVSHSTLRDEWDATIGWSLALEEASVDPVETT